jgi:hypothetical protein
VALHPDFKPDVDLGKRITRQDVETMQRALGIAPEPECIMEQWEAALETLVRELERRAEIPADFHRINPRQGVERAFGVARVLDDSARRLRLAM